MFEESLLYWLLLYCFVNSQTLEITLDGCDFYEEAAVGLLQAVGDCRLSLTISYEYKYVTILVVVYILCIAIIGLSYRGIDVQPLVDALCLVTLPGLIELK